MDYNEIIGANIRRERKKRGLTIEEFSRVIDMAPGFLGLIERGQRGTSMSNLVRIADFFDISLDRLIRQRDVSNDNEDAETLSTVDKDRKALYSMIGLLSDNKVRILTENAKTLNKYMGNEEDQVLDS